MRTNNTSSKHNSPHTHHSSSPLPPPTTMTESIVQDSMESANNIISRCMTASLFSADGSRQDATEFISAVNNLESSIAFLNSINASSSSKLFVRSYELLQMAMKTLMREFSVILNSKKTLTAQAMNDLKSIADCMMNCGYSKECAKIYRDARKSVVDEALYGLRIDRLSLSLSHYKLDWDAIEEKINYWLSAVKTAAKSIFSEERILCDLIFLSSPLIRESCFSEIARDSAVSLFTFPEQVASKCKKSPEKLFKLLDLYEAVSDTWQEIGHIFSSDPSSAVRLQAEASLEKLKEAIQATLVELESAIKKDSSKTPVTGGGVHPLTRYVMNYLSFLAEYSGALEEILASWKLNITAPLPEEYSVVQTTGDNISNVAVRFAWIILGLLSKLDGKSEIYKEVSLSYLFLANNLRYIVRKVEKSEIRRILGGDWAAKHEEKVRRYAASYERVGWSKVIAPLLEASSSHRTAEVSLEKAKGRFREFNGAFMEVQKKHMEWVVEDQELREEIKDSLARNVVTKYREMYVRYRDILASGYGRADCVVKYAPEDLENYLWGLIFGCSDGDSRSRGRSSTTSSCSSPWTPSPSYNKKD